MFQLSLKQFLFTSLTLTANPLPALSFLTDKDAKTCLNAEKDNFDQQTAFSGIGTKLMLNIISI